ncbi:unnamed protein product (macronuclear) [Paramecium tetraurelia]|uniref:Uncharacterized protein n=1 Tax=Paramecium tetraurelia TaxID=5888 RepID=A0CKI5_PARTE|nr:uncharacterized protein GSPATT00001016001 [Paramecium tetraurelia]CAK71302.1 unnamed protein product [Paramecium tetraurelia]|eukprot:XP_001438699.1 hypothetical protein (macronuclear) [Paramecium tetraurelia strain d4-2]
MSEYYLRTRVINTQETTPKRMFGNPNQSYTQPSLNQSPVYLTPDRAMKQPYRNQNQSYNDMSEYIRRQQQSQYPPTYQSSQISIQQEFNNTSKQQFDQIFKRSENSITQESSWFQQKNNNINPNIQQYRMEREKMKRDSSQPFYDNNHQVTDRNLRPIKFEEKVSSDKSDIEKIKQILVDQQLKLSLQVDEYKVKLNKQEQKTVELEKQNKQLKTQLNQKSQEMKTLQQSHISQSKLEEIQDQQMKKFQKIYEQLTQSNDDLREENNQLKLLLLQQQIIIQIRVDNYSSVSRSIMSKKNSEQEFQVFGFQNDNIKELIDQFLQGTSDQLLSLTQDPLIQKVFIQFRDIINAIQFNQHQKLDFQMLKETDFMKIKKQSEDIITVPELNQKADTLIREIKQKMEQMASLNEGDQRKNAIKEEIDRLQKEYDGIQILVTEQSDYLDKNTNNLHRNSIISFDQNFDGEEQQ